LKPKVEGKGAAWAVAHRIAKILWLILHQGPTGNRSEERNLEYEEKGTAPLNQRTLLRKFRRLLREFGRQGINVKSLREQEAPAIS
jgi:hypothetical protein